MQIDKNRTCIQNNGTGRRDSLNTFFTAWLAISEVIIGTTGCQVGHPSRRENKEAADAGREWKGGTLF